MKLRFSTPSWGFVPSFRLGGLVVALMCVLVAPAIAQPKGKADKPDKGAPTTDKPILKGPEVKKKGDKGPQDFNFNGLGLNGQMRTPQLLYFLERANEELERASLEKRSFIPHMVRSLEEEAL